MRDTRQPDVEFRSLTDIFEEAVDTLRTEMSEYSFIALVGAVMGTLVVLFCGIINTTVSLSLIGPLVALTGVLTLATCTAAYGCVSNHMQPDAGAAAGAMLRKLPQLLFCWAPLCIGLFAASYALAAFAEYIDKAYIPDWLQILGLVGLAFLWTYPRSLVVTALFEEGMTPSRATSLSAFIVRESGRRLLGAWAICLAPAALMMALALVVGLDSVTGALVACFFIGAMPLAAAMTSLLFYDAASQIELAPTPPATAPRTDPGTGYRRV
jgi:hypothetical protein